MKNALVVLMAILFMLPTVIVANPMAQRAAATLTNRVMGMLEPQIAELADKAPIPPDAKDELTRQLTEAARRIVDSEIQAAAGGRLPNANAILNKVGGELVTLAENIAQGILDGSITFAGGTATESAAPPPVTLPMEFRPFIAVYVLGHLDTTINNILIADVKNALVATERYRAAPRYDEFLVAVNAEQETSEERIIELAREYEIQQICILSMRSILESYNITAKIIDTETGEVLTSSELDHSLATLADVRGASEKLTQTASELVAAMPVPTFTLATTITPQDGGTISNVSNLQNYNIGTEVTLSATPSTGYRFTEWSGASTSTDSEITILIDDDKTLTANFELLQNALTITVEPADAGSVTREPNQPAYNYGTQVALTAVPSDGYRFANWSGISTSRSDTLTLTMNSELDLTANFRALMTPAERRKLTLQVSSGILAGVGFIGGLVANGSANSEHDKYVATRDPNVARRARENAESHLTTRNVFYIIGLLGAAGFTTVTIYF